jgi:hypothetical protein
MYPGVVAVTHNFKPEDLRNRIFSPERTDATAGFPKELRAYFGARGVDVVTPDMVPFDAPELRYVIYLDMSWRQYLRDPFLRRIPPAKRVLVIMEPSNVNPSLYYLPFLRRQFAVVFTWHEGLLRDPSYTRIQVLQGASPELYRANPFGGVPFEQKRLLCAVSRNRWSYVPYSSYGLRMRAYRHFEQALGDAFDLYGEGWNQPRVFYERWFGHHTFRCYRGTIFSCYDEKVRVLSRYRFSLCMENNAQDSGYVSEKIIDAMCARCVPVYHGWEGADRFIPAACFINFRHYRNLDALERFLSGMDARTHARYVAAIDEFLAGPKADRFANRAMYATLYERLFGSAGAR